MAHRIKNNVTLVAESYLCTSCGACYAICPQKAITFTFTSIGRKIPSTSNQCTQCGLCLKICPSIDSYKLNEKYKDLFVGKPKNVYIGRTNNHKLYSNAQSGGLVTATISYLFHHDLIDNALVCKMKPGKTPTIEGILIGNQDDISQIQKSCYTPVDLLSTLHNINESKRIAVVGLPCHIQGIRNLMLTSNKFKNIKYTLGLICDRTLCNGIQDTISSVTKLKNIIIEWRKKDFTYQNNYYPYQKAPIVVKDTKGNIQVFPNTYRFALKDYFTSPRCRICYDKLNIHSDITYGDPWSMSNVDWSHGDSVVITRTIVGQQLINEMFKEKSVTLKESDFSEVYKGQRIEERITQYTNYIKVVNTLKPQIESYLTRYKGNDGNEELKNEFKSFIYKESLTKKQIIKEAISLLNIPQKQSLIKRIFNKFRKVLSLIKHTIIK